MPKRSSVRNTVQNRIDLGKCTQLYDETQGTMKHKRFRQINVFVRKQLSIYLLTIFCRKRLRFSVPRVSPYRWVHFPRSVLLILSTSPAAVHSFLNTVQSVSQSVSQSSPDVILCGWVGSKHQLTVIHSLTHSVHGYSVSHWYPEPTRLHPTKLSSTLGTGSLLPFPRAGRGEHFSGDE